MQTRPFEIRRRIHQNLQFSQILSTDSLERLQFLIDGLLSRLVQVGVTVKGRERLTLPFLQQKLKPRYPVGPLSFDKVLDHLHGIPGAFPFMAPKPSIR